MERKNHKMLEFAHILADYDPSSSSAAVGVAGLAGFSVLLIFVIFVYSIFVLLIPIFVYRIMRRTTENNILLSHILHEIRQQAARSVNPPTLPAIAHSIKPLPDKFGNKRLFKD